MGMGIAGAAWATTFSQFFGLSIFARILYLRREEFGLVEALDECQTRLLLRRQASSGDLDVDVDAVDVDADAVPACPPTATFVQKYVALVKVLICCAVKRTDAADCTASNCSVPVRAIPAVRSGMVTYDMVSRKS